MTTDARPTGARSRVGIVARMVGLGVVVAIVVAVVTALAAFPLVRDSAESRARADLVRLADLTATTLSRGPGGAFVVPPRVGRILQQQDVDAYVVFAGTTEPPAGVTAEQVQQVTSGEVVSSDGTTPEGRVFVEGRPLGPGEGVVLVQPTAIAAGPATSVLLRVGAALILGIAIAVVVAIAVARRMTRPLREAASAADRIGAGDRSVVLAEQGPAEVARLAESLNRLNTALAASEGRQREFLLSISHELRTPLTAVIGYAQAIADGVVESEDARASGEVIAIEAARLDRLVDDLLDLARVAAVDFAIDCVPCDVSAIVREAQTVWRDRCAMAGVALIVEIPDDSRCALVDPVRMRQIIDNLVENALRVTAEGGRIVLAVDADVAVDVDVNIAVAAAEDPGASPPGPPDTDTAGFVVLQVRDSGPGLTLQDREVAFDPGVLFERYRGVRPVGTGLGLAIVGRLAAGMGGWARAGSAPEGGACFTVAVPACEHVAA